MCACVCVCVRVRVPVIVAGCKLDLKDEQHGNLSQAMAPIMQRFREIETCIECSALRQIQVHEVFFCGHKAVLYPTAPLFDQEAESLKPRCIRALKRIFILSDRDRDGTLNDVELNEFQIRCFGTPLQPAEIVGVKIAVQEKMPEGVNVNGLTLAGFLYLHALFIEKGQVQTTWTVLRKYDYDNDMKLKDVPVPTIAPDQDGALLPAELEDLFSTAPENPWSSNPYNDCAENNVLGGLSLEGFLSKFSIYYHKEKTSGSSKT